MEKSGVTSGVYHSSLVQLNDELENLQKSLAPKQNLLKTYNALPADLSLARMKVEEARSHLYKLEEQLTSKMTKTKCLVVSLFI